MDHNLLDFDITNLIDKYTRFMTKDIYISNKMYNTYLEQYYYLYERVSKDYFLYSNNKKYHKIIDIYNDRHNLIKLHNSKYLRRKLNEYQIISESITLNKREQLIVLLEEENTYVVSSQNKDSLVIEKCNYLIKKNKYKANNILVITNTNKEKELLLNKSRANNLNIKITSLDECSNTLLKDNSLLDNNIIYNILSNYLINNLFKDKDKFNNFYKVFSKYLYLNKDYKEYETFKDYHNYMYKRKYLSSKLNLKKFNEQEILLRKKYLRTINGENVKCLEEVDIANFLYLNSVDYYYDSKRYYFKVDNFIIKYGEKEDNTNLYLNSNKYLEVLAYELIKKRYPLERISDEDIYNKLKNTNIDNYFSEFLNKYLIPLINYYDEFNNLDNVNLTKEEKKEFYNTYEYYTSIIEEYSLIRKNTLFKMLEDKINSSKYKYLVLLGDIPIKCNINTLTIVDNYKTKELLKENIKLLYDYKKYLLDNSTIPISGVYLNKEEVNNLTNNFLKDNLAIINKSLSNSLNKIKVYEYSDANRLRVYPNISDASASILKDKPNALIGLTKLNNVNILLSNNFSKVDKKYLKLNSRKIQYGEILKINKNYDTIVLPFLINDKYHDILFTKEYLYNLKLMIYVSVNKCRDKVIILCPSSKMRKLNSLLGLSGKLSI